jgi:SnoaL-like domain
MRVFPGSEVDERRLQDWLDAYGRAWVSNDPIDVAALFSEGAIYATSPFVEPWRGRERIVEEWTRDPEEQREVRFEATPLAVTGVGGVAHWAVSYRRAADPEPVHEMDGILVLRFDDEGRCTEHREWFHRRERSTENVLEGRAGDEGA